jgi:hypothetical protein
MIRYSKEEKTKRLGGGGGAAGKAHRPTNMCSSGKPVESVMTVDLNRVRIFIRPGYTDLRKAVNEAYIRRLYSILEPDKRECYSFSIQGLPDYLTEPTFYMKNLSGFRVAIAGTATALGGGGASVSVSFPRENPVKYTNPDERDNMHFLQIV